MRPITVYGFGNRGRDVVDQLLASGQEVAMIFDKAPSLNSYRDIPVRTLSALEAQVFSKSTSCLIALHNSYVDIREINSQLVALGFHTLSLIQANAMGLNLRIDMGYWLDTSSPHFAVTESDNQWMLEHLADDRSRQIFTSLRNYRASGDIADSPGASTADEYTPADLPRYPEPLRLIDCGAYTGVAYRKFSKQYTVSKYLAFEPDPKNFAGLCKSGVQCQDSMLLPLGVSDKTEVLRFSLGKDMGSALDVNGDCLIQCVSVDDMAPSFDANLIKFDVEGAETAALLGMKQLIIKRRPNLCVSVYHRPEDLVSIPRLIQSWGLDYRLHLRTHEHNCFGTVLYVRPQL